jgi:hypothetical protein
MSLTRNNVLLLFSLPFPRKSSGDLHQIAIEVITTREAEAANQQNKK